MKKIPSTPIIIGLAILISVLIAVGVGVEKPQQPNSEEIDIGIYVPSGSNVHVPVDTNTAAPTKPVTRWNFHEELDKMGEATQYAEIHANEMLFFDFPYSGGARADFIVRKSPKYGTDVILRVSQGQFASTYNNETVRVRVDDGKPFRVGVNESADGSANILFLEGAQAIIKKMKGAQKLIVEASFYQEGSRQMEFDIEGFQWPIPKE